MADFQGCIVLFVVWLVSILLVRAILSKGRRKGRLPPSPMALPIIGHLHLLAPLPHQALHKLSIRYGPLIHVYLGSVPCVVASSPEMAKEFLKNNEACFSNRPNSKAVDYLSYGSVDFSFAPYGQYWKFMKKICMSELLGGRTLDRLLSVRQEEIRHFLQFLLKKAEANEEIDLGGQLMRVTNNVVSRMTMSQTCSDKEHEADEIKHLVHEIAELIGKFNLSDFIWFCKNLDLQGFNKRLEVVHKKFDTMIERIMMEHEDARKRKRETGEADSPKNLLDILMDIAEDEKAEIKLTRENIKAFNLDMFAAGTDTSAITMEWAIAELINHPEIMKKARKEIASVVENNRLVEESDIGNLPYLQAIVKETLRLHPTGPMIVRESTEDCTINGYDIPARTRLLVNVWAIGRDPNHWENPLEFNPERFLKGEDNVDVRGQHFHLLPFGSGRRGCPATSLALQLIQSTLASMIQCFEWRVNGVVGKVDMEEGPGLALPRLRPLICVPAARLHLFPSSSSMITAATNQQTDFNEPAL